MSIPTRHDVISNYKRNTFEKFDNMELKDVIKRLPNVEMLGENKVKTTLFRRSLMFRFTVEYLCKKGVEVEIDHLVGTRNCRKNH